MDYKNIIINKLRSFLEQNGDRSESVCFLNIACESFDYILIIFGKPIFIKTKKTKTDPLIIKDIMAARAYFWEIENIKDIDQFITDIAVEKGMRYVSEEI